MFMTAAQEENDGYTNKKNRVSDINNFLKALVANRNVIGTFKKLIRTNFTEHQY